MRLVDRQQDRSQLGQPPEHVAVGQLLRSKENEVGGTAPERKLIKGVLSFSGRPHGVEGDRNEFPSRFEARKLVSLQSNKRRDHQGWP